MKRHEVPEPSWEDAKVAIQEFGGWIKNADTKATILAAAVGILVVALLSRVSKVGEVLRVDPPWRCGIIIVSATLILSMVLLGLFLYLALKPRRSNTAAFSRFSWPSVAAMPSAPANLARGAAAEEAWIQAHILARIAELKYRWFNRALGTFWVTLIVFAILVALVELPTHP